MVGIEPGPLDVKHVSQSRSKQGTVKELAAITLLMKKFKETNQIKKLQDMKVGLFKTWCYQNS